MGLKMSSDFNKENQESEVKTNILSLPQFATRMKYWLMHVRGSIM